MKSFDTSLLYVLSGTGNTFRVARWIKDLFEKNGITTHLKFIEHADLQEEFKHPGRQLTTVLFPTHGFMPPWSMIKFLFKMPRQKKAKVLSIATRGALWIGPVKISGAAGFANFFAALVLLFKGYDIRGFFSLDKRLLKFKLKLNKDKTKIIVFNRFEKENSKSFDFLGFTFYLGLTKSGWVVPIVKSSGKKLRSKLTRVNLWYKENRSSMPLRELWESFCRKLSGHVQYYGISFKYKAVHGFIFKSVRIFFKWINRRSQKKSMNFDKFKLFLLKFPPPKTKIYHKLF